MSKAKHKILIVEDDHNLGSILEEYLQLKGYDTKLARDGEEGWLWFNEEKYDLCLVDVMMPKKDGFSLVQDIRKRNVHVPVIFLTAKSMKEDTIKGLKTGADDYITKPFSMEELLLRIQNIIKRSQVVIPANMEKTRFELGGIHFDSSRQVIKQNGKESKLTAKESQLLAMLCRYLNQTLDRSMALKEIWEDDSYFNARSMDVYITKLRKIIKTEPRLEIVTVHGRGFKLILKDEA